MVRYLGSSLAMIPEQDNWFICQKDTPGVIPFPSACFIIGHIGNPTFWVAGLITHYGRVSTGSVEDQILSPLLNCFEPRSASRFRLHLFGKWSRFSFFSHLCCRSDVLPILLIRITHARTLQSPRCCAQLIVVLARNCIHLYLSRSFMHWPLWQSMRQNSYQDIILEKPPVCNLKMRSKRGFRKLCQSEE